MARKSQIHVIYGAKKHIHVKLCIPREKHEIITLRKISVLLFSFQKITSEIHRLIFK